MGLPAKSYDSIQILTLPLRPEFAKSLYVPKKVAFGASPLLVVATWMYSEDSGIPLELES